MGTSQIVKNFTDGSVVFSDGTGVPVTLAALFDQGDLSLDGLKAAQRETNAYESRGILRSVRHTTRTYPSGSMTLMLSDVSDGTDQTAIDFVLKQGSFSGNISTLAAGANADVYCINIALTIEGTDLGDTADHTITMDDCEVTMAVAEGDPNTISLSWTVYGTVTMT